MKKISIIIIFTILFLSINVLAKNPQSAEINKNSVTEEKFDSLVKEVFLENAQLKSDENQIFVSTLMIDLLWERDENTARQLAEKSANILRSKLVLKKNASEMVRYFPYKYDRLRHDFIVTISKYNLEFANELKNLTKPTVLSATKVDVTQQPTLRYLQTKERDLEQKMAFQVAAKDLNKAEKLAKESLERGNSHMALNTLRRFQTKDIEIANKFADIVIDKLLKADFKNDRAAKEATSNLIRQLDKKTGTFGRELKCKKSIYCTTPLSINENKLRILAGRWLNHAMTASNKKISFYFLNAKTMLLKILPRRKAEINKKYKSIKNSQPKRAQYKRLQEKSLDKKISPSEIAKMALNKSDKERFTFYRYAFTKAARQSKAALETLLLEITKHPENEEKNWVIDSINRNIAGKTADEGDLDKALELARKIKQKDMQTSFLTYIARKYYEENNMAKAILLTDEITLLLDLNSTDKLPKSIVSYDKFSSVFILFATVNPERAFLLLETVMPDSNTYFVNKFGRSSNQEINLRNLVSRNRYAFTFYSKSIKRLVETDFERVKKLLGYLEYPELSVAAKILLLKSISGKKFVFNNSDDAKEMVYRSN